MMKMRTLLLAGAATMALGMSNAYAADASGAANGGKANMDGAISAGSGAAGTAENAVPKAGDVVDGGPEAQIEEIREDTNTMSKGSMSTEATMSKDAMPDDAMSTSGGLSASESASGSMSSDETAADTNMTANPHMAASMTTGLHDKGYTDIKAGGSVNDKASFTATNPQGHKVDLIVDKVSGDIVTVTEH